MSASKNSNWFTRFATAVAFQAGRPLVFALAVLSIVVWAVLGPAMGFSEAWQLTINTSTTIVTFLMVFIIQNTQNRDAAAVQIKLDELIRVTELAHNTLLNLEELSPEELEQFRQRYARLAEKARRGVPELDVDRAAS
jgi:low affinity Fe/Cu permease